MKRLIVAASLGALGCTGCASIMGTTGLDNIVCGGISGGGGGHSCEPHNKIYIGVREDVGLIREGGGGWVILPVLDTPLSLAMDTVFLPYTVIDEAVNRR